MARPDLVGLAGSLIALAASLLNGTLASQTVLLEWQGPAEWFGWSFDALDDIDGDGVPDIVIPDPGFRLPGLGQAGRIDFYSGRDGGLIHSIFGTRVEQGLGGRVLAAGDFDGDGAQDVLAVGSQIVGNQVLYHMEIYSSRTGALLRTYNDYWRAAAVGDVDGDGVPDLVLADPWAAVGGIQDVGYADVISGRTGSVLRTHTGTRFDHGFGNPYALGDIDGDGVPDYAISAHSVARHSPFFYFDGFWAYSGRTGNLLLRVAPPGGTNTFPAAVCGPGDLDGDGLADIVATDHGPAQISAYAQIDGYSGPSGPRMFTLRWDQPANSYMGGALIPTGDVDGDGYDDFLAAGGGQSLVFSGRDRSVLHEFRPRTDPLSPTRPLGDINGDDFPDLLVSGGVVIIGGRRERPIRVYSGAPEGVVAYGSGCADPRGVVPRIGASYAPRLGNTFGLNLSRVSPASPAVLLVGGSNTAWAGIRLPMDLSVIGMPGCALHTSPELIGEATTTGPSNRGRASFRFTLPTDPQLSGARLYAQWLVLDPGSRTGSATRGLEFTLLP